MSIRQVQYLQIYKRTINKWSEHIWKRKYTVLSKTSICIKNICYSKMISVPDTPVESLLLCFMHLTLAVQCLFFIKEQTQGLLPCSICWCWPLTANLLTWTGIGTTILGFLTGSPDRLLTLPALILFHLARRFWNQIFTWTSLSLSACAICERSVRERYFLQWNSFSSSSNCSLVKAVRLRLLLPAEPPGGKESWEPGLSLLFWDNDPQLFPSEKLSFSLSPELSSLSLHAASADFRSSFSSSELYSLVSPKITYDKINTLCYLL